MGFDIRLAPAIGGAVTSAVLRACCTANPAIALGTAAIGVTAAFALTRLLPVLQIAPHESFAQTHHVGIRHIKASAATPPLTVFYPTNIQPRHPVSWLPHGDWRYARGFAQYAHMPEIIFHHMKKITIAATKNATPLHLLLPPTDKSGRSNFRPVIIFSHGLAGHGHICSALCCDLAAQGAIVITMEHRDGSAAFCRDANAEDEQAVAHQHPPSQADEQVLEFRHRQLAQRVEETRGVMGMVASGELLHQLHYSDADVDAYLQDSKDIMRPLVLAGHSFGGATALVTAVEDAFAGRLSGDALLSLRCVALFDLWGWPTEATVKNQCLAAESGKEGSGEMPCPLLLFDSEQWERWDENRAYEESILCAHPRLKARREVVTGTDHYTACDMSLLIPRVGRKPYKTANDRDVIASWARKVLATI